MQLRRLLTTGVAAGALLLTAACAGNDLANDSGATPTTGATDKGSLTISGQDWYEAAIVANMYKELLTASGYDVSMTLVGTRDIYMAKGQFPSGVDVVPEYVGGLVDFLNAQANGPEVEPISSADAAATIAAGKSLLDAKGITLLNPSTATDTNAFFVAKEYAAANNLTNLSEMAGKDVVLAAAPDCKGRSDCEGGLKATYGINITKLLPLGFASEQTYQSVLDGESQLGETQTTDGTVDAQGAVLLADDKGIQPAGNLVPAVSTEFLAAHPDVADTLNALMAALTTEKLAELNAKVSVDRAKPEDVAHDFLTEAGLV